MKSLAQQLVLIGLISVAYLSFQNCSKTNHGSTTSADAQGSPEGDLNLGGTGNGYDGKIYAHEDPNQPCNDGDHSNDKIWVPGGTQEYYMIRTQCQNTQPQALDPADIQVISATEISYRSEVYVDMMAPLPPPPVPAPAPASAYHGTLIKTCTASGAYAIPAFTGNIEITISQESGVNYALVKYTQEGGANPWARSSETVINALPDPGTYSNSNITLSYGSGALLTSGTLWLNRLPMTDLVGTSGRALETLSGIAVNCP